MRDVGHDEADQHDSDGDHLGVLALRAGHGDRDAENDEQRAEDAKAQRVQRATSPVPSSRSMHVTASTRISAISPDRRARGRFWLT